MEGEICEESLITDLERALVSPLFLLLVKSNNLEVLLT